MKGSQLDKIFSQVWVINLKRRNDRLVSFFDQLNPSTWPFQRPEVYSAIEGDKVGVPKYWQTGGGSYGCLRSHMNLLERAIQDDVDSMLILEDDAILNPQFTERVARFFERVPEDWECLMLGGQHVNSTPIPVAPGVVKAGDGGGIQRTHCYAIRGSRAMKELYRAWANSAVHCDWVMGPCMAMFKTFAPEPFLVGQADGESDISGTVNPAKYWRPPTGREAIVLLRSSREVMESLQQQGFHGGYDREHDTGIDRGLLKIFSPKLSNKRRKKELRYWVETIQWEVASMVNEAICTVWHPDATKELLEEVSEGTVIEITASSVSDALAKIPPDLRTLHLKRIGLIILKCRRETMELLRRFGFHTGYSRNLETGRDQGVEEAFQIALTSDEIYARLQRVARVLNNEAVRIQDGIAALWHPDIDAKRFDCDEFDVLEISSDNIEAILAARKAHFASSSEKETALVAEV